MCTLAFYFQEFPNYPLVIAANRDEFFSRPSAPPETLAENPAVLGGKDLRAGGTWLGVNEYGLVAGILNRRSDAKREFQSLRSRGLLCLDVLKARNPAQACAFLHTEKGSAYQPFNLLIANAEEAYVSYNRQDEISCFRLKRGLHIISNTSVYESHPKKLEHAVALFTNAKEGFLPAQEVSFWIAPLKHALSDHAVGKDFADPKDAICVHTEAYGTVSSSLIFYDAMDKSFRTYFAPGPPCRENYGAPLSLKVQ